MIKIVFLFGLVGIALAVSDQCGMLFENQQESGVKQPQQQLHQQQKIQPIHQQKQHIQQQSPNIFYPWIVSIVIKDSQNLVLRDYFVMLREMRLRSMGSQIPILPQFPKGLKSQESFLCSGILISPQFVLTSAKCVYNLTSSDLMVGFGLKDLQNAKPGQNTIRVSKVIVRRDFNTTSLNNNLALLQLAQPIQKMSKMVNTICLPTEKTEIPSKVILTGFGYYEPITQFQQRPDQSLRSTFVGFNNLLKGRCEGDSEYSRFLMCVVGDQNSNVCLGDDGSAVFNKFNNKFYLDGVVSFFNIQGMQQQDQQEQLLREQEPQQQQQPMCNPKTTKITVTNVRPYLSWINSIVKH